VTVVGNSDVAFKRSLGDEIGGFLQRLHEKKGVQFRMSAAVEEFVKNEATGDVEAVILRGGERLKADVVVLGVGVTPNTDFLEGSGIDKNDRGYVKVDANLETNVKGVFAAGDIASFPLFCAGDKHVNIGHWQVRKAAMTSFSRFPKILFAR